MDYDPATPIYVAVRNSLLHTDWRPASSRIWPQSALGTPIGLPDLLHLRHRQCTAHPPRPGLHLLTRRSICKMEPGNWKTTKRKRGNPAAMAGMTELTGRSASKMGDEEEEAAASGDNGWDAAFSRGSVISAFQEGRHNVSDCPRRIELVR
ncbi:uncharacterized protein LOC135811876 [Sycon ciliatum]|uniref:uncharacterized protein LOC135811876 n=1 Tax=Sycon ciliatum TaxID=27933 RepID=UPI0031F644CE